MKRKEYNQFRCSICGQFPDEKARCANPWRRIPIRHKKGRALARSCMLECLVDKWCSSVRCADGRTRVSVLGIRPVRRLIYWRRKSIRDRVERRRVNYVFSPRPRYSPGPNSPDSADNLYRTHRWPLALSTASLPRLIFTSAPCITCNTNMDKIFVSIYAFQQKTCTTVFNYRVKKSSLFYKIIIQINTEFATRNIFNYAHISFLHIPSSLIPTKIFSKIQFLTYL